MRKFLLMASFIAMLGGLDAEAQEEKKVVDETMLNLEEGKFVIKYTYDNRGREILRMSYAVGEDGELTLSGKVETTYDSQDRVVMGVTSDYIDGAWVFYEGIKNTYDDENNATRTDSLMVSEGKFVPNGYYETDTVNAAGQTVGSGCFNNGGLIRYYKNEYDAEGRETFHFEYKATGKGLVPTSGYEIEYDGENKTTTESSYEADGQANEVRKWTENKDGNWLYAVVWEYDSEKNTLVKSSEEWNTYYENGDQKTSESYGYEDGEIVNGWKQEFADLSVSGEFARGEDRISSNWDSEKKDWVFVEHRIDGYDEDGNYIYHYYEDEGTKRETRYDKWGNRTLYWDLDYNSEEGTWEASGRKYEHEYNEDGKELRRKEYELDEKGEWQAVVDMEYAYNDHGAMTIKKGYETEDYYDDEEEEYVYYKVNYDYKYEYTYNEVGDETLEVRYTNVDGTYVADRKWVTEYDESGKKTSWKCFALDVAPEELRWQVDYTYNEAGKIVKEEETDYTGEPNRYTTYEYDERGNLTAERDYSEYEEGEYGLDMVKEYTYDAKGRMLTSQDGEERHEYTYDAKGVRTDIEYGVAYEYDEETEDDVPVEVPVSKKVRDFDEEGRVLYEENYKWEDGSWSPEGPKYVREYDENGNLVMEERYVVVTNGWEYETTMRYEYDEQGREIRRSESSYDEDLEMVRENEVVLTTYDEEGKSTESETFRKWDSTYEYDEDGDLLTEGEWQVNLETGKLEVVVIEANVYKTIAITPDDVTAVDEVVIEREADGRTYDLSGREVVGGYRGLAIRNGKLVYIK